MCWVNHDAEWEGGKSVAISINNQLTVDLFNCRKSFSILIFSSTTATAQQQRRCYNSCWREKGAEKCSISTHPKSDDNDFPPSRAKRARGRPTISNSDDEDEKNCFSKDFFPRSFLCVIQKVLLFYYQQRPGLLFQSGSVWWRDMCVNMRMSIIVWTLDSR